MLIKSKLPAIFLTTVLLILAGGLASADTMEIIDGRLQFQLGSDAIFVRGSTSDYQGDQEADIWFSPKWINGSPPAGIITSIEVNFTFDETLYEFTGAEKTAEWPGDLDYIHNGNHIYLLFSGAGVAPSDGFKKFAYMHFTAKCQPFTGQVGSWLVFDDDTYGYTNYAMVTEGVVTNMYVANPRYDGFLMIDIYRHIYTIDNVEAYLGDEITVPVYAETDFRMFSFHQFLNFDYSNLDVVNVIPNPVVFPDVGDEWYWSEPEPGLLEVYLVWECMFWPSCFVSERSAGTKLYDIVFRVTGDQDDITLPLTFVDAACFDSAWTADRPFDPCEELDNSINPPGLIDGSITIPSYVAAYEAACDADYIAKSGGTQQVAFNMRMSTTFPAGDYSDLNDNGGIEALFELQPFLSFAPPVVEDFPDLDFHSVSYANGETILRLYQYYNSQLGNVWPPTPELSPLLSMNFNFIESNYEPSYDDRTIALKFRDNFVGGGYDWHAQVEDTSGSVAADSCNGKLTWTSIPVEVKMGEFFSNYATSATTYVEQDLFIRANLDMGEFSVNVSVNNGWTISSVNTYENVIADRISSDTYRIHFDSPYFHDATGDNSVTIATVKYRAVCSSAKTGGEVPGPGNSYRVYASTSFSNAYIHDDAAYDHFLDLSPSGLRATCSVGDDPIPHDELNKDQLAGLPIEFNLYPNRPNPFNPTTAVAYDVPVASYVKIEIINILGRSVATIVDEQKAPGHYQAIWNGTDESGSRVSSGIYLYSMQAGNFIQTKKMMLMK